MNVSVIGLAEVGCVCTAWLARLGHTLVGVDVERQHGEYSGDGPSLTIDSRFDRLLEQPARLGKFRRATDLRSAVLESDISLICVQASTNANGSQNLRELDDVFRQIGTVLAMKREYHVVLVCSTVLPGTTEGRFALLLQQHSGRRAGADFGLCITPAISWRIRDIDGRDHPDQVVIGELDSNSGDIAQQLYNGADLPIIRTTIETAEILDYVSNAFHAVKIAFANEIGNLCATHGIDAQEVIEYFLLDRKLNISAAYLRPGFAFGGPRLTNDLRALLYRAKEQDVDCPLLNAVLPSNQRQIFRALELVEKTRRSRIGILGLGAKAGADIHDNGVIYLAEMLAGKGYRVRIFGENIQSPAGTDTNTDNDDAGSRHNVTRLVSPCLEEVIQDSEVVVLASCHSAIRRLHHLLSENHILIDLVGAARQFTPGPTRKYDRPGYGISRERPQ